MLVKIPKGWEIAESRATPESVYVDRRTILKAMGLAGIASGLGLGCYLSVDGADKLPGADSGPAGDAGVGPDGDAGVSLYPAPRNPAYTVQREITPEELGTRFNNYYEFTTAKDRVWTLVGDFETRPWTVEIGGLVNKPQTLDIDTLERTLTLEERVYRFRCVEAWAATIPWTGFPLAKLIERVEPLSSAKYVAMKTVFRPEQMPGIAVLPGSPWPYSEGLRMDEATNELTLMVTGVYGKQLPAQNGAPLRLIVPWKYGFKSIKSIVAIDFLEEQPATFWNTVAAHEYSFLANVDPGVPHPRWSQAQERLLGEEGKVPTQVYNGYGEYVAQLY